MKREGLVRGSPDVNERHGPSECLFMGTRIKGDVRQNKSSEKGPFRFVFIGFECLIMTTCRKSERCEGEVCDTSLLAE